MIKQSLQLKLGQKLTMTPQLQQAIRLLQLSTLELQTEIQDALDSNLLLEALEEEQSQTEDTLSPSQPKPEQEKTTSESAEDNSRTDNETPTENLDTLPTELSTDSNWEDTYEASTSYSNPQSDGWDFNQTADNTATTLRDHLLEQLSLRAYSENDRAIALAIIDAINPDGYLTEPVELIHTELSTELDIDLDEVEAVLHSIQSYDPVGVGATSIGECISLQLNSLDSETPHLTLAKRLSAEFLDVLAAKDFKTLMRRLKINEDALKEAIELIQQLNPRPGSHLNSAHAEYVIPDVYVRKNNQEWVVDLNPDVSPKLGINKYYENCLRAGTPQDRETLKQHLQEARWFIKSLHSRNDTLLKVARCIVERQKAFFDYGVEAMKPMILREIAEAVDMHESTISRVTTQKYMHTPRGILEFKYFFSSHVSTSDGGECSATAIHAMIRKLISEETPRKPFSDSKLADMLSKNGISVARRTVAKYREAMQIPPSNERKQLI